MKNAFLLSCFLFINASVFAQFKEGQVYFKLKTEYSLQTLSKADQVKLYQIQKTFSITKIERTFQRLQTQALSQIYTVFVPVTIQEEELVKALKSLSGVEYAERVPLVEYYFTPNDPLLSQQWYLGANYINAYNAWNVSTGSASVKIAIVDDEVRLTHEDLQSKLYINTGEIAGNGIDDDLNGYVDDSNGWDAADNDNNPNRPLGAPAGTMIHGTHCAGIAAAATNNALGIASIGNGVRLIPVKVSKDANTGTYLDNPYGGVEYAIAAKANVVSMSWGGGGYSITAQLLFDYGYSQGIVFVAAAGNSSSSTPSYPAAYNHVIAVAASTTGDAKSGFSNYGTWVDITAPGSNIYSCIGNADNTYGMMSGTSMACPMVAGLCALMISNNPSISPDSLEHCLKISADNIDVANPNYIGELGAGRIDAYNALNCLPCLAKATFDIGTGGQLNYAVGSNIAFTSTGFGNVYKWLLNGTLVSSSAAFAQVFSVKGNYSIQLIAIDNLANCTDTVTKYFTVFDSLPNICQPLQEANWSFGVNASLSFVTDPPIAKIGTINMVNGSSSIADPCGNLIFYSDGMKVWDKNGLTMPNGTGLLGSSTSCRSAMIVPKTDSVGVFYVFTIDFNAGSNGLRYSIVDMRLPGNGTLANPLGAVRIKNVSVSNAVCERQTAILHANGRDYWLITHDCNNNNYYSFLVTSTGISAPVVSTFATDNFSNNSTDGDMRFSPDGKRLAVAYFVNPSHNLNVFDFNRTTGVLSNQLQLSVGVSVTSSCAYGVEFSSDCSKLYATTMCTTPQLIQYDFNTSTKTVIYNEAIASGQPYGFGEMKIGPNNKIYVNRWGYSTLGVIHNPNGAGLACNYCESPTATCGSPAVSGLNLAVGSSCKAGLTAGPKNTFSGCGYTFDVTDSCVNYPISFHIDNPTIFCRGEVTYSWNFGDITSTTNTSIIQNPSHVFSKTGNYLVTLKINSPCDSFVIVKMVSVICCSTTDNTIGKSIICAGDTAQLYAPHSGISYTWTPTSFLSNATVANPKAFPSTTTIYSISITQTSGCIYIDTVIVDVAPKVNFTINEAKNCGSDTLSVIPMPLFYAWSTGQLNQPITVTQSGNYWAIARNVYGCYDTAHIVVDVNTSSIAKIQGDTIGCIGDSVLLKSSVKTPTLLWSNGSSADAIFVKNTGWYKLTYTNGTCTSVDSVFVRFTTSMIAFSIGSDTSYCGSFSSVISTFPSTSLWSTGVTGTQIVVSSPGIYWAEQSNVCGLYRDSILIEQQALPIFNLGRDSSVCIGDSLLLSVSVVYDSLVWSNGNKTSNVQFVHQGNYWLELYKNGCSFRDSVNVSAKVPPNFLLPADTLICENEKLFLQVPNGLDFIWDDGSKLRGREVNEAGLYWLTVFSPCGNYNDSLNVTTESCECEFAVPTAFSPNKDGVNDVFRVLSTCPLSKFRLSVFNRWGEKVFETDDYQLGWNGMYKSDPQPMGTFVWTCSYYDTFEKRQKDRMGNVTIIR